MKQDRTDFSLIVSHEEAEKAELQRRRNQTPLERMMEFSILQERVWGEAWTSKPMVDEQSSLSRW
jgi:hypothetical protein